MAIIEKLRQLSIVGSIVVMPDFFVDRIIRLESKEKFFDALGKKAARGGGSVRGVPTADVKGGNAVNVAYCLAKLGVKVALFTVADEIGAAMIRQAFSQFGDKVTLRITSGKNGLTTAFEFPHEDTLVNVMMSDIGDNANFGPERLGSEADRAILKNADGVIVTNWASNQKGTELTEFAFRNSPSAFHFIDPADIDTRKQDFASSLEKLASMTDCLSINENECNSLADALGLGHLLGSNYSADEVKGAAKKIAGKVGISIDLHSKIGAAWSNGRESTFVHAIKVDAKTITGAGDSWDAADIIGYLAGLDPQERLLFANCCASLYIRDPQGEPPAMNKVFELVERVQ
ncbi:MAG: carbohydrate kinase family protein [Nitrososphaera sp.]|uniref:PfkB family carbohydrate kinase n=1 Tax=Nitrososphaera gargensis (strain Ga9.2) TaxID=1237085 RepID=K0IM29_NITGG|nr:carbohydrate kinase family protein [Candidatus Nitrososphaera gargensis]AFU59937.1 pfkB family carbohydrate kinase [Candidatus Nitrososphaera gargensis Ga9.2]